jgi:hypothetical protein
MNKSDNAATLGPMNRTEFHHAFPQLSNLLLAEWPELNGESLSATHGELDHVVSLIVEKTGHTRTLVRRQLAEIFRLVTSPSAAETKKGQAAAFAHDGHAAATSVSDAAHEALHSFEAILTQLEKKAGHLVRELRGNVVAHTTGKIRQHPVLSSLIALGLGFIFGVLFKGLTRGR